MKFNRELIDACIEGDRKSQEELYKLCFAPMLSICYRFTNNKDDACILLNGAFFKVITNLEKQQKGIPFFAWVKRITVNHCIDQNKKRATRNKHEESIDEVKVVPIEPDDQFTNESSTGFSKELLKEVKSEILNLPPTTQEVFQLHVLDGLSHKEIAQVMEMKEGTSKWHVNNARTVLRAIFDKSRRILSSVML